MIESITIAEVHKMRPFVHLHTHSEYSIGYGFSRIPDLVEKAAASDMPALALTDYGNLFGAAEHVHRCASMGIKPITGCDVLVSGNLRSTRANDLKPGNPVHVHLILLCKNETGYKNLCALVSPGNGMSFHGKPSIDFGMLKKHAAGLICLSSCKDAVSRINGFQSPEYVVSIRQIASALNDVFGPENFFIELQNHGQPDERDLVLINVATARMLDIGIVATNDSHYTNAEDWEVHDLWLRIQTRQNLSHHEYSRFPPSGQFYFKTGDEMALLFSEYEGAIENTLKIADMCDFELCRRYWQIPHFNVPSGSSEESYLSGLAGDGLEKRKKVLKKMAEKGLLRYPIEDYDIRLEEELKMICGLGFSGYFLMIWDILRFIRVSGIPVGSGSGFAVSSLVAYALEITDIDPIQNDLLFVTLLNEDRILFPFLDTQISKDHRDQVISYVIGLYGNENVSFVPVFKKVDAHMALEYAGEISGFSPAELSRLTCLINEERKMSLTKSLKQNQKFRTVYEAGHREKRLIDLGIAIEGLVIDILDHQDRVIIAPEPIIEFAPVFKYKNRNYIHFDQKNADCSGLPHCSFPESEELTIMTRTLETIKETQGVTIDIRQLLRAGFNDSKTYELLARGEVEGIRQFENPGLKNILCRLNTKRFEDLITAFALSHSFPPDSPVIATFIERAHGTHRTYSAPENQLEGLKDILSETYGLIVYKEQILRIIQHIGKLSAGQADILFRAMRNKKTEIIQYKKDAFFDGVYDQHLPKQLCEQIFSRLSECSVHRELKTHCIAMTTQAFQMACLKANYPDQFTASLRF